MNNNHWQLYKESAHGEKVIELFDPKRNNYSDVEELINFAHGWGYARTADMFLDLAELFDGNFRVKGTWEGELTRDSFEKFIASYSIESIEVNEEGLFSIPKDAQTLILHRIFCNTSRKTQQNQTNSSNACSRRLRIQQPHWHPAS